MNAPNHAAFWAEHEATFGPLYAEYRAVRERMYRAAGGVPPWIQTQPACELCGDAGKLPSGEPSSCDAWPEALGIVSTEPFVSQKMSQKLPADDHDRTLSK